MKDTNKKLLIVIASVVLFALIVVGLVLAEELGGGKLIIKNKTDMNITDIKVYFNDEERGYTSDWLYEGKVDANDKMVYEYEGYYDFTGMECECFIEVTFDDRTCFVIYDGDFRARFTGNFELTFFEQGGDYFLRTKAGEGLFKNTSTTDMDTDIILDFDNAEWDYVW